jgi:hypothetical protein
MQTILKKYPFKGTGKLSKLLDMILLGHEQNSRVSHPSKQFSAGYHTPLNQFLKVSLPFRTNIHGVLDPSNKGMKVHVQVYLCGSVHVPVPVSVPVSLPVTVPVSVAIPVLVPVLVPVSVPDPVPYNVPRRCEYLALR